MRVRKSVDNFMIPETIAQKDPREDRSYQGHTATVRVHAHRTERARQVEQVRDASRADAETLAREAQQQFGALERSIAAERDNTQDAIRVVSVGGRRNGRRCTDQPERSNARIEISMRNGAMVVVLPSECILG